MPGAQTSPWLAPHWPDAPANIGFLYTTRRGGVSPEPYGDGQGGGGLNLGVHVGDAPANVLQNRQILRATLPAEPAWLSQVHGTAVVDVHGLAPGEVPEADASIAAAAGDVCTIMTADCLPVLFSDAAGKVVGAAHAGWRGLAAGVLTATVDAMRLAGAGDIVAWLGPAIGPDQFEVGGDVLLAFRAGAGGDLAEVEAAFRPGAAAGKYLADIYALARLELRRAGVVKVAGGDQCTLTQRGDFYSYRRDGVTGRQASLIWIK